MAADATTYTYDAGGNQTASTTPAPAGQAGYETTSSTYDGDGNLIQTSAPSTSNATGAPNQVTHNSYNASGQLASATTGYGTSAASTTSYCYNPNGNTTSVVMPNGNTSVVAVCETSSPWVVSSSTYPTQAAYQTTSSYDSVGELVSSTSPATSAAPSGATTAYTYDPAGNMLTSIDPDKVTTTWSYTPQNLRATASYSGSSAHSVTYTYDADGQKTAMTDATGSSSYTYDPFGELTSATNGANQAVGYGYEVDGNTTSITYPLPASATWATTDTVTYGYNAADVLDKVTDFNGHSINIGINADSLPSSEALGSTGDSLTYTYDADAPSAMALVNGSTSLLGFTYSDAPAGNILAETDAVGSSQSSASYTYDAQDRVTSMTPSTGSTRNYAFDASGDTTTTPTGATGGYDHDGELTSTAASGTTTTYAYSADGERLTAKQGSTTIASGTWNGARQLTAYSDPAANMSAATYDGDGDRATATTTPSGGSASTQDFVWNDTAAIPQLMIDSGNAYIYGGAGTPQEQVSLSTGAISYLVTDRLGSVRGVVNSAGALIATTAYDAWGNPQTSGGLTSYTPFGFAGGYTDPTGLIYLINRYYDPATGQFTQIDPDVAQTLQPYEYASDNPISNTDPTGERNRQGLSCWTDSWGYFAWGEQFRQCTVWLDDYWTTQMVDALNWGAAVGASCAAVTWWIPAVDAIVTALCLLFSGLSWLASSTIGWVNDIGHHVGVYFRVWLERVWTWYWGRRYSGWWYLGGYVWHQ